MGGRITFADIAFLPWQRIVMYVLEAADGYNPQDYPVLEGWLRRIEKREAVERVMATLRARA